MDCLHCYSRPDAKAVAIDMTEEQATTIADQLIEARVMHVHFGGGEPLGRKDFLPIAKRLADAGVSVTLSTNGSLLMEDTADALASLPVTTTAFSVHGSNASSHDAFNRFPGAWNRLVPAIQRMVQRNLRVKLVMTLTKQTAPHAVKLLELADEWNVFMVQFQTFKHYGNASLNLLTLNLSRQTWVDTFRSIQAAQEKLALKKSTLHIDPGLDSDPILATEIGLPSAHEKCACGIHSVTIRPNGDVTPCAFAPEIIGNVHHTPLIELWRSSPALKRLRDGKSSPCGNP